MDFQKLIAALMFRDFLRGRRERERVRYAATVGWEETWRAVEGVVVDDYAGATEEVMGRLAELDVWIAGLAPDAVVEDGTARFTLAQEPFTVWAKGAKPRLDHALVELNDLLHLAPELRRPAEIYALISEVIDRVEAYDSAADAYLAGDFEVGGQLVKQAHIGWRQTQTRYGVAKYP
jgi:hypothetical protein